MKIFSIIISFSLFVILLVTSYFSYRFYEIKTKVVDDFNEFINENAEIMNKNLFSNKELISELKIENLEENNYFSLTETMEFDDVKEKYISLLQDNIKFQKTLSTTLYKLSGLIKYSTGKQDFFKQDLLKSNNENVIKSVSNILEELNNYKNTINIFAKKLSTKNTNDKIIEGLDKLITQKKILIENIKKTYVVFDKVKLKKFKKLKGSSSIKILKKSLNYNKDIMNDVVISSLPSMNKVKNLEASVLQLKEQKSTIEQNLFFQKNLVTSLNKEMKKLKEIYDLKTADNSRLSRELDTEIDKNFELKRKLERLNLIDDSFEAEIMEVNTEYKYVVINKGVNSKLKKGLQVIIKRNGSYVGGGIIFSVYKETSIIKILEGPIPEIGDGVILANKEISREIEGI